MDDHRIDRLAAEPVFRQVATHIRRRIANGDYAPGQLIPSEVKMSAEFGVAAKTIRSAIRLLTSEGLINTVPNRGSYVVPSKEANTRATS